MNEGSMDVTEVKRLTPKKIVGLYANMTISMIIEKYGLSYQAVWAALDMYKVERRTPQESSRINRENGRYQ